MGDELLMIFARIGDNTFAVDIRTAVSIIEPKNLRRVPLAPPYINTILNYHGTLVTVLNIGKYYQNEESAPNDERKIIYLKEKDWGIGLLVDQVLGTDYVSPACGEEAATGETNTFQSDFTRGTLIQDDDPTEKHCLDMKKLSFFLDKIEFSEIMKR